MKKIDETYLSLGKDIIDNGIIYNDTVAIFNKLVQIDLSIENDVVLSIPERKFSVDYAEREFEWYLSGDKSVRDLVKYAKIWDKHHSGDYIVNSNYGALWNENDQLNKVKNKLLNEKYSRRCVITLYDGKRMDEYKYDTPCTLNLCFYMVNKKLNLSVIMRSNDYWYGFPNDVYCFVKLQNIICKQINAELGIYTHFVVNMHIYNDKIDKVKRILKIYGYER